MTVVPRSRDSGGRDSPVGRSGRLTPSAIIATVITSAMLLLPKATAAQSPTPEMIGTVDPRTSGAATMVGGPVEVLVGVVLLGAVTAAVTAVLARLLQRRATGG